MMILRRIFYLFGMLFLAVGYLLTLHTVFVAMLCVCALLPLVSLMALLFCRNLSISVQIPNDAEKLECVRIRLLLSGRGPIGIMRIRTQIHLTNRLTGESLTFQTEAFEAMRDGTEAQLELCSSHCGKISLDACQCKLTDSLGLFCKTHALHAHASTLIRPDTFEVKIDFSDPDMFSMDSDDYSASTPGNDPSERFGIRDYREGDSLRSIHWKLSEKYNRTVINEMSLPVAQSILLLMDNCPTSKVSADAVGISCEALLSVSQALAALNVPHHFGWFERENGMMQLHSIASLEYLSANQELLLSSCVAEDAHGLVERMLSDSSIHIGVFHRILIFAAEPVPNAELLSEKTCVLTPEAEPVHGLSSLPEHLNRMIL